MVIPVAATDKPTSLWFVHRDCISHERNNSWEYPIRWQAFYVVIRDLDPFYLSILLSLGTLESSAFSC